ncbi:hypothetical protein ACIGKR_16780 [Rhodococcus qingshengii]|uniref:hypothetical protein n=1 Tax=Rhodococcus qingshengii TaxID=334542 RepID=UPI0037C9946C
MHLAISNVKHEKHYFSTARHFGCKYVTQQDMGKSPEITAPTRNISVFRNPLISPIRKWVNLEKKFPGASITKDIPGETLNPRTQRQRKLRHS